MGEEKRLECGSPRMPDMQIPGKAMEQRKE